MENATEDTTSVNMQRFETKLATLQAVAVAASTEKTRFYLAGVCVQPHHASGYTMTATDGHILIAARVNTGRVMDFPAFIIPATLISQVKAKKNTTGLIIDRHNDEVTLRYADSRFVSNVVDGTYPDWKRVLPAKDYREVPAQYDIDVLARIQKATNLFHDSKRGPRISVLPNGTSPAVVSMGDERIFAIVMPYKVRAPAGLPAWV